MSSLRIKCAFFMMYIRLLGNYLPFFGPSSSAFDKASFDTKSYLSSLDASRRTFVTELARTQNFSAFIERTCNCFKERNEVGFFIEGTKLAASKGEKALENEVQKVSDRILQTYKAVLNIRLLYQLAESYIYIFAYIHTHNAKQSNIATDCVAGELL